MRNVLLACMAAALGLALVWLLWSWGNGYKAESARLTARIRALEAAVETRDAELKGLREKWNAQEKALETLRRTDPDFYDMPLPDGLERMFGKETGK